MKILVAFAGSKHSSKALQLAEKLTKNDTDANKELYILTIVQPEIYPVNPLIFDKIIKLEENEEWRLKIKAATMLNKYEEEELSKLGAPHSYLLRVGDPGDVILDQCEEYKIDIVILGNRGLGTLKRTLLGSVSDYVSKNAKCTVVVAN